MQISRIVYVNLLLLSCLIIFGSCKTHTNDPIKIGTNSWIGYEPLYLARNLDYYKDCPVSLTQMPSASDVMRAFRNGLIDCATLTLDETYTLLQDSIDVKMLFIMDISNGADVIMSKPEIKTLADLKGKRIGVESSAVGAYTLCRALEIGKISPHDITQITLIEADLINAFKSGEVDAVVTFEPYRSQLLKSGANVVFDSRQIPNEIFDVFIVNADIYKKREADFLKLKEIWFQSLKYIKENPDKTNSFICKRLGFSNDEFEKSLNGIIWPNKNQNKSLMENEFKNSSKRIVDIMVRENLLENIVDPEKLKIK